MEASITSRTEDQVRQAQRLAEDVTRFGLSVALEKINPDRDGLQRFIESGDEIKAAAIEFWLDQTRAHFVTNQYIDEQVASNYGYLSGYDKPVGIDAQIVRLDELFPNLGTADVAVIDRPLPEGAEGWFAVPRRQAVAETYGEAVQKVLDLIKQTRGGQFYNYREGCLGPEYLRLATKTAGALERLYDEQARHDILVIPAQLGLHHRGRSVRRALECMNSREFGLDPFTFGIMLLTHPNRLSNYDDLWVDCAGAEYASEGDGVFGRAPCFRFSSAVEFDARWVGDASGRYGSASGFLPQ